MEFKHWEPYMFRLATLEELEERATFLKRLMNDKKAIDDGMWVDYFWEYEDVVRRLKAWI